MTPAERQERISRLRSLPANLERLVISLSDTELKTRYIATEWSVQQIVHHLVDSHMNSVIRLKLILSEERPPLKGYDQDAWADQADVAMTPISASLAILHGLHERWGNLFESLTDEQYQRVGAHSEIGDVSVEDLLDSYADHGEIHIDQIERVLAAGGIQAED